MQEVLKKAIYVLIQIPLLGGLWVWQEEVRHKPLYALLICLLYEIGAFVLTFSKKVWIELEHIAIKVTARWLRSYVSGFSLSFSDRYRKQVINEHGTFNVRGLGLINTYTLALEQVFVDLRVDPSNPQRFNIDPLAAKKISGNRPIWDFLTVKRITDDNAICLAIIGPPGCGKTTLLQHIAVTLASKRHRRYRIRSYNPILLFLRDHITTITQKNIPIWRLTENYFKDSKLFPNLNPPRRWFKDQLKKGRCIVLLDGLDEVGDLDKRKLVSDWIDKQIINYPNCHFIITSRPQGYRDTPLSRVNILEVQPFNAGQVRKFVENWYLANEIRSSGNQLNESVQQRASRDANDLLQRLSTSPSLSALTVNPLLLTMIAMVHRYHGALPGSRVELYAEICEVLLGRWRQARGVKDKLKAAQKLVVLRPLAAYMMERKLRDIRIQEAIQIVNPSLKRIGIAGLTAQEFLSDLQASSGVLLEREAGRWSFAHLTFQEYLTASHWLEQKKINRDWSEMAGDSWWQETLRLYAAQSDSTQLALACLKVDSVETLALANDCLEEACELDAAVRSMIKDRVIAALESTDTSRRHLAAQVQLSRRLKSLQRMDDGREIDLEYLTCAEYQLFIDSKRAEGEYHQPDHWTSLTFNEGEALNPVKGVRAEDAEAFCNWLTDQQSRDWLYRLPRPDEAIQHPAKIDGLASWCQDRTGFALVGLTEAEEQDILNRLKTLSELPLLTFRDLTLSHTRALERDLTLALAYCLDFARSRDRTAGRTKFLEAYREEDLALAQALARDLASDLNFALERNRDREFALDRDPAIDLALARDLAHDIDLARAFFFEREHRDFEYLIKMIDDRDLLGAQKLAQSLKADPVLSIARRAILLNDLLLIATAESKLSARPLRRKYIERLLEYSHEGFKEIKKTESITLLRRFLSKTSDLDDPSLPLLELHWWQQIVAARKEGKLFAWEGLRIVREHIVE